MSIQDPKRLNITNRKAKFNFELLEKVVAGIVLQGSEIKSIREGKATIGEAYCFFKDSSIWIKGMHINEYSHGSHFQHDPNRDRKLLLKKEEVQKWKKRVEEKGLTVVPLKLFISDRGFAKMELALGKGKKVFDKREDIKKRDTDRDLERARYK